MKNERSERLFHDETDENGVSRHELETMLGEGGHLSREEWAREHSAGPLESQTGSLAVEATMTEKPHTDSPNETRPTSLN